jgi:hypothetical protein
MINRIEKNKCVSCFWLLSRRCEPFSLALKLGRCEPSMTVGSPVLSRLNVRAWNCLEFLSLPKDYQCLGDNLGIAWRSLPYLILLSFASWFLCERRGSVWQSLILRLRSCTGGLRDEAMAFTYLLISKDKIGCKTLCLANNGSYPGCCLYCVLFYG